MSGSKDYFGIYVPGMGAAGMIAGVLLAMVTLVAMAEDMDCSAELKKQQSVIGSLTRQIMMQQLNTEESTRAGGDSGIKQIRASQFGTRPFYTATHTQNSVNAIHDHSQNSHTVGMGEVTVVMNGVEFRTRHNDYALRQPHKTSTKYNAAQYVDFPEVPPEVLAKDSIKEQVDEMRLWFKAWKDQNTKTRDYRKYFKPVLCYMEGSWTQSSDVIDEPFESDRHFVDASSWWDLTEKVRFTAYSGTKSNNENYSFLPMKIMNLGTGDNPVFAQWNYKILCAPIKREIPTRFFRPIDDLSIRIREGKSLEEYANTRKARFEFSDFNNGNVDKERQCRFCFIDNVMAEIPGKDNYQANLTDNAFGNVAEHFKYKGERLNSGYYHRVYQGSKRGAMGTVKRNRGFADRNIFMAQTSQSEVPSMKVTDCVTKNDCTDYVQRWSYAIPLEVIYLTPLYSWNPYNISYVLDKNADREAWDAVVANGRNGGFTKEKAYNGNRRNVYYRTPEELFEDSGEIEKDPADTSKGTVGVLDHEGDVQRVVASGTRIFLPDMPGVGILRTRYPISPIHNDGNQIYKEVEALKDIVTKMQTYQHMYREQPSGGSVPPSGGNAMYEFRMTVTTQDPPGMHDHAIEIAQSDVEAMMVEGVSMEVDTDEANSHSHSLVIRYDKTATKYHWVIVSCDGQSSCWDGHAMVLEFVA